ncbi:sulfotransferase [Rhodanobacter sp. DHB23]|uniref:tetratricopeptide repeat-containing sulfotransferase family protein n=1 Tax=Rhodanobacter sp. DHB23 TaxID=2775923 RepID=UPI001782F4A1|nr:sulfotransferase [Rhodanobacter sp. DHB23]MBD8874193.1 sulfotransferase [Rhodanobacter sp. DHB23]
MTPSMAPSSGLPDGPSVQRLLHEARRALGSNQTASARHWLAQAQALAPDDAEAHRLLGVAALIDGDNPQAIGHLRDALAVRPGDATIHMTLGNALFETGEADAGLASLQRACELAPGDAAAWYNLGRALQVSARMQPASEALRRAVELAPDYARARNALATVLANLGDTAAAVATLRETLRRHPDNVDAWFALGNLKIEQLDGSDAVRLRGLFRQPGLPDDERILVGFTLAKALEDQADYPAAFDVVREANAMRRRQLYWSRDEERARVEAIAGAFAQPLPSPLDDSLGQDVIFVTCMPRSGSTLVEQILASHPEVDGGDEIPVLPELLDEESARRGCPFPAWVPAATAADWHRLGTEYLERTRHWGRRHLRFTDKNVGNWAFVGAALAMLPGARVVNARRDPLETCFACYRQLFATGIHYSYDLDDIVDYYAGYARLAALWRQRFPRQYFDHDYEALTQDAEAQIRRLLQACGLPFDAACLAHHRTPRTVLTISSAQVRQPLRGGTARAPRYGDRLDPLRDRLRAAGLLPASD